MLLVQIAAVVIAVVLGAAAGWVCGRLPVPRLVQDLTAAIAGWLIGSLGAFTVVVLMFDWIPAASGGLGAVSVGLSETILIVGILVILVLAFTGRALLDRSAAVAPIVRRMHAPAWIGAVAALLGALLVVGSVVSG